MTDFVKKVKLTELENKIPDISSMATKTALTTVENKIPDVSDLVNKTDNNTKVTEIENKLNNHNDNKYIDTSEFNELAADVFNVRLTQASLITKTDFDAKLSSLDRKITQNRTKHLLVENELNKLKTFDSSYYNGKNYFEEDGIPNYFIYQPLNKYFKVSNGNLYYALSWASKGLSNESIKPPTTTDNSLTPVLNYYGTKTKVSFEMSSLKQDKVTFNHGKIVDIYIVYKIIRIADINGNRNSNLAVQNALFGAVSLTKNAEVNKYKYSGYGIAFDRTSIFSFPGGGNGQNVIIFGADINSSIHVDNRGKDILIFGKGPTQGLGEHLLTAEKTYSIHFSKDNVKFCLSLHYNGANCYLFVNGSEIIKFKAKISQIAASPLCLGNISKDWSTDDMRKSRFTGYVYDFSVGYDAIGVDDIKDIHKYLMKKNNMV